MAEYVAVWYYFLCARELAKLHGLIRKLRMPLFLRDDLIQMSFSQTFIAVLEVFAEEDVGISDLSVPFSCCSFWLALLLFWFF